MTPEYVLLTAATDINRLTHPPVVFQAFVHIAATDTPLGKASHTAEPRSQERGSPLRGVGRAVLVGEPSRRPCPPRSRPCLLLSGLVLTPAPPRPHTFRGFSHVLPAPQNSLPLVYSGSNFETRLNGQPCRTAPPPQGGLAAQCVGHACGTPTEAGQGLPSVPPAPDARLPPSCLCTVIRLTLCCDCRRSRLSSHRTLVSLNGTMLFLYTPSQGA